MDEIILRCIRSVKSNYEKVKKWNRREDIFSKEYWVLPVNAFGHWFMYFIVNPEAFVNARAGKAKMVYCDSMFEIREFITAAIRTFISEELKERKGLTVQLDPHNLPCYSLALPRQTNCHDCGLYMLAYI